MWPKIACGLLVGYLCFSRTFAYLGIPAWKVFVGEVVLALLFLCGPKVKGVRWPRVAMQLPELKGLSTWYVLFLGYGVLQVLHAAWSGNPLLVALRDLAFNYYPIYFLLGLWAGVMRPDLLPKLLHRFAWFNGVYGICYLLFLSRVLWVVPGVGDEISPVPVFPQPIYSFVALLGLLAYRGRPGRSWHLLLLNGFVMLGMQFRTEWLAFAVGAVTWCIMTRQGRRLLQAGAVLASLLAMMYITDLRLPGPELRGGGDVSVRQLIDRAVSPFRADVSDQVAAAGIGETESQEATLVWRTVWWLAIWNSAHEGLSTALWGHGYGFPLGDLVPYLEGEFIRTPHNEFFYALGYTGWVGVGLFFAFELQILRLLWKAFRVTGESFGVVCWAAMMTFGMFFPLGETPYGAIPFYLLVGWIVGSRLVRGSLIRRPTEPSTSCASVVASRGEVAGTFATGGGEVDA
jgi:hypothetical protein